MSFGVYYEWNSFKWGLGAFFCHVYQALDVACSTASILNLLAISLDRYSNPFPSTQHRCSFKVYCHWPSNFLCSIRCPWRPCHDIHHNSLGSVSGCCSAAPSGSKSDGEWCKFGLSLVARGKNTCIWQGAGLRRKKRRRVRRLHWRCQSTRQTLEKLFMIDYFFWKKTKKKTTKIFVKRFSPFSVFFNREFKRGEVIIRPLGCSTVILKLASPRLYCRRWNQIRASSVVRREKWRGRKY